MTSTKCKTDENGYKNRDGTYSNGYFNSDSSDCLEDIYIDSYYKVGDRLAKDLGIFIYLDHLVRTRFKRLFLIIKRKLHDF
jgi:hypothetical protein